MINDRNILIYIYINIKHKLFLLDMYLKTFYDYAEIDPRKNFVMQKKHNCYD